MAKKTNDLFCDFCGKDRLADDGDLEVLGHDGLDQAGGGGAGADYCRQRLTFSQLADCRPGKDTLKQHKTGFIHKYPVVLGQYRVRL